MELKEGIRITWLGHSTFRLDYDGQVALIDPFLTPSPVCPDEHKTLDQLDTLDSETERLKTVRYHRDSWSLVHKPVLDRLAALDHEIARLEHHADVPVVNQEALRRPPPGREPPGLAR